MKAIRWLLKLVLVIMTLPLILAVWLIKWFVVFLYHCSAWIFYLLGSVLLATAILSWQNLHRWELNVKRFDWTATPKRK
jgi:hypothetical protein